MMKKCTKLSFSYQKLNTKHGNQWSVNVKEFKRNRNDFFKDGGDLRCDMI